MKKTRFRLLAVWMALLAFFGLAMGSRAATYTTVSGTFRYGYAQDVLKIVNQQRQANGRSKVVMTKDLTDAAMKRAAELAVSFSHTRPNGQSCSTAFKWSTRWGENINWGPTTPAAVMNSWMNSSGHRANILSNKFTSIGIGCFVKDGTYYWVQVFNGDSGTSDGRSGNQSAKVNVSRTPGVDSIVTINSGGGGSGTCTIKFNANGGKGSMSNQTIAYGATVTLRKNAFTRPGYIFKGWSTSKSGSVQYKNAASVKNASTGNYTVTFYAVWSQGGYTRPTASKGKYAAYVHVTWEANSYANNGYYVYRTTTKQFKNAVRLAKVTSRSYNDRSAQRGGDYWYWIAPIRTESGSSTYILPKSGAAATDKQNGYRTVSIPKPSVKSGKSSIKLTWSSSSSAKNGYFVYRGTSSSFAKASKLASTKGLSYVDKNASRGRTYYYWILVRGPNVNWYSSSKWTAGRRK